MLSKGQVEEDFQELLAKLKTLKKVYNPEDENLHFNALDNADEQLYEELLFLGVKGLSTVNKHREYFLQNPFYDDGMYWYDLCVLIGSASAGGSRCSSQRLIPDYLIHSLLLILVYISEYSCACGGDMLSRKMEALRATIDTFCNDESDRPIGSINRATEFEDELKSFVPDWVNDLKRNALSAVMGSIEKRYWM